MNRLLSRREKDGGPHRRGKSRDKSMDKKTRPHSGEGVNLLAGLFKADIMKKSEKDKDKDKDKEKDSDKEKEHAEELEKKVQTIKERMHNRGYTGVEDAQITYVLGPKFANGDVDLTVELLVLFQQSVEGIIKPSDPNVPMLGAVNRRGVTCYLDALLFAMFARMDNFEPLLHTHLDEDSKRRLSTFIRLWVNMLRTGKLIPEALTEHLQEALAACGWEDACKLEQQDTSEAYSFITEALKLPLLTLRMDLYHNSDEPDPDDHKYIEERLLDIAVPDQPADGHAIRLEDCLENYFNNQVQVRRVMDVLERTNTNTSIGSDYLPVLTEKEAELSDYARSLSFAAISPPSPESPYSPGGRQRAASVIRQIVVEETEKDDSESSNDNSRRNSVQKGKTIRKEVLIPAWQFFNLIPWVTGKTHQSSDRRIPENLSMSPAVTICLKRYGMSETGAPIRKNTFVDIPTDIRLPHFVGDDRIPEEGPMIRKFKLSLQSFICHQGNSLNEGHYIAFARERTPIPDGDFQSDRRQSDANDPPRFPEEKWLMSDDLGNPRVREVGDIKQQLKTLMPYILFYRVEPIYEISSLSLADPQPPSYSNSTAELEDYKPGNQQEPTENTLNQQSYFDGATDVMTPSIRLSAEIQHSDTPRTSVNLPEDRRGSIAFTESGLTSAASSISSTPVIVAISAPVTPNEETAAQRMSRAASKVLKATKSRPTSQSGEGRMSGAFSRLNLMRSKDSLNKLSESSKDPSLSVDPVAEPRNSITIEETQRPQEVGVHRSKTKKEKKKREKSQGPSMEYHELHEHHLRKGKGRAKEIPDRECTVM